MPNEEKPQSGGKRPDGGAQYRQPRRNGYIAEARALLISRKKRELFFNATLLGEPAWDVLLLLYAFSGSDGAYPLDDLIEILNAPSTVFRRWLSVLEEQGLVKREQAAGLAAPLLRLTPTAEAKLDTYFSGRP